MTKLNISLDDYEEPKPVPDGVYVVFPAKQELQESKTSTSEFIMWTLEVTDEVDNPELNGRQLRHITTIKVDPEKDPDGSKTAFSLGMLKKFFLAFGYEWGAKSFDPEDLVRNKNRALATVTVGEYQGREVNNITAFTPVK